jgi:protein-disulfide isomerase
MGPTEGSEQVGILLAGITQSANALGSPTAPVTLEYFGDLECPFCREFTLGVLPSIIEKSVRAGDLRIEYRALETATREPEVFMAQQVAALAAGKQNRAWDFIETFYREQGEEGSGYVTETYLRGIASQIPGLDLAQWETDRRDPELAKEIAGDEREAEKGGLNGTPSFLIGRTGGPMTTFSPTDPTSFDTAIERLLQA